MHLIELPTFDATWWPVYLETVVGSGERLAVAVVVRAGSGQSQVRQLIPPSVLAAMFGSAASGMKVVVVRTVTALQTQLDSGTNVSDLRFPFGGTILGERRECVATDLNEVFEVAFRLAGAFGISQFGAVERPSDDTRKAFEEWAENIRLALLNEGLEEFRLAFKVKVAMSGRKSTRIGFVHGGYAANFGVLRPGRSSSSDVRALKVKIFDLEALRRTSPLIARRTEVLVGVPETVSGGAFTKREVSSLNDSWDFIRSEAKQRNVEVTRYARAEHAAEHIKTAAA